MPGKQTTKFFTRRIGFISAAATLLVVMVAWVAVRAVGPAENRVPTMVVPSATASGSRPSFGALPWRAVSPSSSAQPTPIETIPAAVTPAKTGKASSGKPSTPATSKPTEKAPTTKPTTRPPATPTPPPAAFTATYATGSSWNSGIVAWIQVTNTGGTAAGWKLTLSYDSRARVRVTNSWNAENSRQDETHTFTGGTLAPGASITFGFEATKQVRRDVQPTTCAVEGTPCRLS